MYFFAIHNREERQCSEQKPGIARILQSTYQIAPDPAGCQLMKKSLTFSPYNADNPFVFIRDKVYYTRYPRKMKSVFLSFFSLVAPFAVFALPELFFPFSLIFETWFPFFSVVSFFSFSSLDFTVINPIRILNLL